MVKVRFTLILLIISGSFLFVGIGKASATQFIQPFYLQYSTFSAPDEADAAKANFVIAGRGGVTDKNGNNAWNAIKTLNPNSKIYLYQFATSVYTNQDSEIVRWVNTLARWNVSRGLPQGSLYGDHPNWFVYYNNATSTDSSNIVTDSYGTKFLQFGLSDYQAYFLAGTLADLTGQPWSADGVFLDGAYVGSQWPLFNNTMYADSSTRIPAMINFVENTCSGLHSNGQLCAANLGGGGSTYDTNGGIQAWQTIDANANHPDVGLEEGTFSNGWNGKTINFQTETNWQKTMDTLSKIHNMKVAYYNSSNVISPTNPNGTDNYGKQVNFWDVLWFDLTSFIIGKNDVDNNSYFGFGISSGTNGVGWYPEYTIDLGASVGNYQVTNKNGTNIYWREFQKGYVYVNPTNTDVSSIALPQAGKQLTHDNLANDPSTLPDITTVMLFAHQGTIIFKSSSFSDTTPPAVPTGLAVQ